MPPTKQTSPDRYRQAAQEIARGEMLCLTITGASMMPILRPGDMLIVQPVEGAPSPGEIVVAQRDHDWITHRLMRVEAQWCFLRGDNARSLDEPIALADVVGRVTAIERAGHTLDLQRGVWPITNQVLSWSGRWQMRVLGAGRNLAGQGHRSFNPRWTSMTVLFVWPFQVLNRIVVWLAEKC